MALFDTVVRRACIAGERGPGARTQRLVDIGITGGRIAAVVTAPLPDGAGRAEIQAAGRLLLPGLVDSHIHLDKSRLGDRCQAGGPLASAMDEVRRAKAGFTPEDVYARGRETLEACIVHGTTRLRTHVEVDPVVGLRGLDGVRALAADYAWAVEVQLCVFAQDGLTNVDGAIDLLARALATGASVVGGAPYADVDPFAQIDAVFALARTYDVDVDLHLDLAEHTDAMTVDYVCDRTDELGLGGRVAVGHVTQLALVEAPRLRAVARRLADAGVGVTVLPSTDLYLMGRAQDHAAVRGVVPFSALDDAGVVSSVATNNVLNPFTPYGDCSLVRMTNLYANLCHVARPADLAACLDMVSYGAATLMRLPDYGIEVGLPADLVCFDAGAPDDAVAEVAEARWGMRRGRMTFERPAARLLGPSTGRPAGAGRRAPRTAAPSVGSEPWAHRTDR